MKKFLLPESGNFYKANLHFYTNILDGALTPTEIMQKRGKRLFCYL